MLLIVQQGCFSVIQGLARCRIQHKSSPPPHFTNVLTHIHTSLLSQWEDGWLALGSEAPLTNLASRCPSDNYCQSCTVFIELHTNAKTRSESCDVLMLGQKNIPKDWIRFYMWKCKKKTFGLTHHTRCRDDCIMCSSPCIYVFIWERYLIGKCKSW